MISAKIMTDRSTMSTFVYFFILEIKRFFLRKNVIVLLLFLLLSLYFIDSGVNRYKNISENKEEFKKLERLKVEQHINYSQYGKSGFRLLFIPSTLSIMFDNAGVFSEINANIDAEEVLSIYSSSKGKELFDKKSGGFKDFSGVILLLGSIFVLYFGYESFRYKEYLKFLSSLSDHKKVFFSILFSRIILVVLFFLFNIGSALILLKFNDIILSKNEYSHLWLYLAVKLLLLLFFYISGTIIGTFKSKSVSLVSIVVFWFAFVFFIPGVIESIIYKNAGDMTPVFKLELEKFKSQLKFKKRAFDEDGRLKISTANSEHVRALAESYRNNECEFIRAIEEKMENEMRDNFELSQKLSLFFPSTFYLSTGNETSSRGYQNFNDFYINVQKLKKQFVGFYLDKVYYSNNSAVESFIKKEENVFYGKSRLPIYFGFGVFLNFFYIILLLFVSYSRFKKTLFFSSKKEMPRLDELQIKLEKGKCTACVTSSAEIRNSIFGFFSSRGKDFFTGKIEMDGCEIEGSKNRQNFIYLCHQDKFPGDIKTDDFFTFCRRLLRVPRKDIAEIEEKLDIKVYSGKKFRDLDDNTKGDILFSIARLKKSKVYFINEMEKGMPQSYTNKLLINLQELKKEKAAILYVSSNLYFTAKVSEKMIVPGDERIENILK
jgi:ABC-type transport system involved in multi-copper enzyme maturation permease subunit/ABC-type cobalamin/Fe3+-siderophores transport system ATPase subunit